MTVRTVDAAVAVPGECVPVPLQGRGAVSISGSTEARSRQTTSPAARSASAGRAGVIGFVGDKDAGPPASPSRLRRAFRALRPHLGTVAGVTILGVLLWRLGTGVFLDGLRRIDVPTLFVGLGIGLLTTVFSAWRWVLVARSLRIELPLLPAVADYYRSLFLNAALPGGVLGDVHRAVRHGKSAGDMGRGVRAVVLERAAGQVALLAVGGAVLLTQPSPVLAEARRVALVAAVAALGAVAVLVAVRMNRAPRAAARRTRALRAALTEARGALLSRENLPGVALSSLVILSGHLGMFVVAARVAGSSASVAQLLPIAVLALLAMGLPLNVGGWGPREGVTAWAFGAAGLGASMGLSVAVVYGVLSFVAALPGALVLVVRYRTLAQCSTLQGGGEEHPTRSGPEGRSGKARIALSDNEVVGPTAGRAGSQACGGHVRPTLTGRQRPVKQEPKVVPRSGADRNRLPWGRRGRQFWSPSETEEPVAPAARATAPPSVSIEKYAPKDSAKLASNAFPFSAEPSEGRPMTPESV
ncbi:lysylphosphatidylglycerol synthase transmembrane domain-containing protein [Streptomyces sp. NPDC005474]|uniref:lysylphosphatidylglycerol synthase transmembrane domain-containing protein n=1 Tax=Streptomyces sp. NPDC005474 TaxID=3154878 RepID=UPI003456292E